MIEMIGDLIHGRRDKAVPCGAACRCDAFDLHVFDRLEGASCSLPMHDLYTNREICDEAFWRALMDDAPYFRTA